MKGRGVNQRSAGRLAGQFSQMSSSITQKTGKSYSRIHPHPQLKNVVVALERGPGRFCSNTGPLYCPGWKTTPKVLFGKEVMD